MDALEAIITRRSTRNYKPDPVKSEKIEKVLEARMMDFDDDGLGLDGSEGSQRWEQSDQPFSCDPEPGRA